MRQCRLKKYRSAFSSRAPTLAAAARRTHARFRCKNVPPPVKSARPSRRTGDASANSSTDIDKKLARAARSAQRLAQLSSAPAGDTTLDLFAEETERATLPGDEHRHPAGHARRVRVAGGVHGSGAIDGDQRRGGIGEASGAGVDGFRCRGPCYRNRPRHRAMPPGQHAGKRYRRRGWSARRVRRRPSVNGGTASGPSAATRFEDEAESTAPTRLNAATVTDADTGSNVPEAFSAHSNLNEAAPIDAAAASSASRALGATSESNATTQPVAPGASPHQQAASATNPASRHGAEAVPIAAVHASAVVTARSTSGADLSPIRPVNAHLRRHKTSMTH